MLERNLEPGVPAGVLPTVADGAIGFRGSSRDARHLDPEPLEIGDVGDVLERDLEPRVPRGPVGAVVEGDGPRAEAPPDRLEEPLHPVVAAREELALAGRPRREPRPRHAEPLRGLVRAARDRVQSALTAPSAVRSSRVGSTRAARVHPRPRSPRTSSASAAGATPSRLTSTGRGLCAAETVVCG